MGDCSCNNNNNNNSFNNNINNEISVQNLNQYLLNNESYGLVDLRSKSDYESNGHFPNSTNIPLEEFEERMFELPPRLSNIGIIYSDDGEFKPTTMNLKKENGESESVEIKTIRDLILFKLINYSIKILLSQNEINSNKELKEKQVEFGNNSKMLWRPCLYISKHIETIESKLNQIYGNGNGSGNGNDNTFKAIDIACGSGRDCLFLANRKCWNVVGVDNDETLLNKMLEASKRFNISNHVNSLLLELEPSVPKDSQEITNQDSEEKESLKLLPTLLKYSIDNEQHTQGYDLVHVARYLHRPLFPVLKDLIKPGGFILYHTFMVPGTKPRRPRFLLNPNELKERFSGFNILDYQETKLDDGRPIQVIFAQKPLN